MFLDSVVFGLDSLSQFLFLFSFICANTETEIVFYQHVFHHFASVFCLKLYPILNSLL